MATALSGSIIASAPITYDAGTGGTPGTITAVVAALFNFAFTNGTGANQMDLLYGPDVRTLGATTGEDLDLAGGVNNSFGTALTFARVKLLCVLADSGNNGLIQVGGAAATQFVNWVAHSSDIVNVRADGMLLLVARDATGYAVTGGTGDLLKIYNSGAAGATYTILVGGCSA